MRDMQMKSNEQHLTPEYYVGIGASAGGLEAIESFFKNMPTGSKVAFIVIQHLSPDYKSLMVELLSKKTDMPVYRAEDGMDVEANRIYLIPPKKNLTIFHGKLMLSEQDHTKGVNLPIDIFLRSLAEDQGEKAVAVILSGTGSDGMRGIRAIKEHGGMVMVQDEETAKFDGMPRAAISTGLADFVIAPEGMPRQLLAFMKHPRIFSSSDKDGALADKHGLNKIFALIKNKTKVDFTYYKENTVNRRIERRMTINQIDDLDNYIDYLQRYPGEIIALHKELLIGVTSFFRDPETFDYVHKKCLPNIVDNVAGQELRLWIAGCSTGEEAYTLAMLLHEYAERIGRKRNMKVFATDIDKDAIQFAANGVYPESIAADIDQEYLGKYFHKVNEEFRITRMIREMVVFAQHNLIKDPPFTNINLVSCRNLLIYLQQPMQKKVLECFNFSLNPGGYLLLGSSETTGECAQLFEPVDHKHKIFRSKGIHRSISTDSRVFEPIDSRINSQLAVHHGKHGYMSPDDRLFERFIQTLEGEYFTVAAVLNAQYEVIYTFGDTEGFFKLPSGRSTSDITKMTRKDLSIPLSTGVMKAFKSKQRQEYTIKLQNSGEECFVKLIIKVLPSRQGLEELAAIFINEVARKLTGDDKEHIFYDLNSEAEERIKDLENDLQFTRENLQATIEELETSNEELQATNEELLASNEELQSTNEELQSTNEELHTVNAEHQSRIFELTELHNDIDNILTSTRVGILLLDENLCIRRYSPPVQDIINVLDQDVGRPFCHLSHTLVDVSLNDLVDKVQNTHRTIEQEVRNTKEEWFQMRLLPYSIGPKSFAGVVMTFVDISHIITTQNELEAREAELRETASLAKVGSWKYLPNIKKHIWSPELFKIFERNQEEYISHEEVLSYFKDEHQIQLQKAMDNLINTNNSFDIVAEIQSKTGEAKWVRILGKINTKQEKDQCFIGGAAQDITALKSAEAELAASKKETADIIEHMPGGLFLYQLSERKLILIDGNAEAAAITGKELKDIIGQEFDVIWSAAKDSGITDKMLSVLNTGQPYFESSLSYHDEALDASFRLAAFPLAEGRLAVAFERITDKMRLEESLRRSEESYRHLFENMTQGVVYQSADGTILDANPAAEEILGLSLDQMRGRTSVDPRWRAVRKDGSDFPGDEHPSMVALREAKAIRNVIMGVFHPGRDITRWINISAVPMFRGNELKPYQVFATFDEIDDPCCPSSISEF